MGLFSRGESRSRSEDGKTSTVTLGWFSRSNAEPSRQALSQLMKDFAADVPIEVVDRPPTAAARSRSNTVTTNSSVNTQYVSRPPSFATSRPPTRQQQSFQQQQHSRPQTSAGSFLSKSSRILKRAGSKAAVRPQSSGVNSPNAPPPSDVSSFSMSGGLPPNPSGHEAPLRPVRSTRATTLSGPADSRHIKQLAITPAESFTPISKAELEAKVEALATKGKISDAVVSASKLPSLTDGSNVTAVREQVSVQPVSPIEKSSVVARLEPESETSGRVSRFSWAPNYMLFSDVDFMGEADKPAPVKTPTFMSIESQPQADDTIATSADPLPLPHDNPQLPAKESMESQVLRASHIDQTPEVIVQSVIDAPSDVTLTSNCGGNVSPSDQALEVESAIDVQSIRLSTAFPLPQSSETRGSSEETVVFGHIRLESIPNMFASSTPPSPKKTKSISIGFRDSDLGDWEEAIDYSWEHADDFNDDKLRPEDDGLLILQRPEGQMASPKHDADADHMSNTSGSSHTSTPALVQSSGSTTGDDNDSDVVSPRDLPEMHSLSPPPTYEPMSPLLGLGLGAFEPSIPVRKPRMPSSRISSRHQHRTSDARVEVDTVLTAPDSPLSHSSSQYSIVLSIASSLQGTHRSSQSSGSFTDYARSIEHEKHYSGNADWRRGSESQSSCISTDSQALTMFEKPKSWHMDGSITNVVPISALPPQQEIRETGAKVLVPSRSSSISAVSIPTVATAIRAVPVKPYMADIRPRRHQSRASYSLFPPAAPPPSIPTARLSRMPTIVQ